MLVQAVVYKSANKVSDEELLTDLPLQHTLHSVKYWRPHRALITLKGGDYVHPECSRLGMAPDEEFRLGAAPGKRETHVKLVLLMGIFTLDNDHNSKGNLYVKSCRTITPLYPKYLKIFETNWILPSPFKIDA